MEENSNEDIITFESKIGNKYIYLPNTGFILTEELLKDRPKRKKEILSIENRVKAENFKNLFQDKSNLEVLLHLKKSGFQELLLEVTTGCNLRCSYCVFSGNYKSQRMHGNEMADYSEIKMAIDLYFKYITDYKEYNVNRVPTVAFYGGEPLLNFSVIKESIIYIRNNYNIWNTFITLTTNGTLLNEEMIDFFVSNDVWLVFSLDGGKSEHDRNRKTAKGFGSFEKVYHNICNYQKKKGGVVFINSVYDYKTNLSKVIDFFEDNPMLINLSASMINPFNTNYFEKFDNKDITKFYKNVEKIKNEFLTGIKSQSLSSSRGNVINLLIGKPALSVTFRKILGMHTCELFSSTGSCVPGEKIFVDINGNIRTCEKVASNMIIGNIKSGLNIELITKYINNYNREVVNICKNCKYRSLCSLCYQAFWNDGEFKIDAKNCVAMKNNIKEILSLYTSIYELDPNWFDSYSGKYYSEIRELGVTMI